MFCLDILHKIITINDKDEEENATEEELWHLGKRVKEEVEKDKVEEKVEFQVKAEELKKELKRILLESKLFRD